MPLTNVTVVPITDDGPFFEVKGEGFFIKVTYPWYKSGEDSFHPFMLWAMVGLNDKRITSLIEANKNNLGEIKKQEVPVHTGYSHLKMRVEAPATIFDVLVDSLQFPVGRYLWGSI